MLVLSSHQFEAGGFGYRYGDLRVVVMEELHPAA